jgi:integrase
MLLIRKGLPLDRVLANHRTPIAVQQKLMRHADIRTTMNIYGDVVTNQESEAHSKIVSLALPRA